MPKKPRNQQKKNPPKTIFGNPRNDRTKKVHISRGGTYGDKRQPAKKSLTTTSFPFKGEFEAKFRRERQAKAQAKKDIDAGRTSVHKKKSSPPKPRRNPRRKK